VGRHVIAWTPVTTRSTASDLAAWALALQPTDDDLALARRALVDTVAVSVAAADDPLLAIAQPLGAGGRLAVAAHVLDYDDLHLESTSHISAICVPAAAAAGGDARSYLAAAGVMARLGARLGWAHYDAGWHATCTAGAPAAAVAAGVAAGLDADALARAIALAVPAAGGNHRAFGTHGKSLQVGFAVDAGLRAAALAAAGATADPQALDAWLALVGASGETAITADGGAIPGGLAVKLHPCCYALQRPIAAVRAAIAGREPLAGDDVTAITVSAPEATLRPLIHDRPRSGLEGKFSLPYAVAATLLDGAPGLASFSDEAVARTHARELGERVEVRRTSAGADLLSGTVEVEVATADGATLRASVDLPPGAPGRPPTDAELTAKVADCCGADADAVASLTWDAAATTVPVLVGIATPG
jgi:2-methylcitrate dehydratase PrpD